jgi:hypothetical protein
MTFPRLFGTFALVLAAASLAAAQQQPPSPPAAAPAPQAALSPYTAPQVPPSAYHAPQPPPTTYLSLWQAYPYYGVPQPTWALSVSGGKLLIESADGSKAVCEALTIPVEGAAAVELTVEGKHIHVRSVTGECGKCCPEQSPKDSLAGSALRVSRNGPRGCVLTLEGEATLSLVRKGKKAELTAERISVDLVTDRVEGYIGHPPQYAPYVTPVGPQAVSVPIDSGANAAADPLVEPVAASPCTSTSPSPAASPPRRPR